LYTCGNCRQPVPWSAVELAVGAVCPACGASLRIGEALEESPSPFVRAVGQVLVVGALVGAALVGTAALASALAPRPRAYRRRQG